MGINLRKIKDEIINERNLSSKRYSNDDLSEEIYKRAVLQVATAYALNLHINSYLHGTSSHPFSKIELDESSNSA
ncbi:MAG: hypothetical protein ACTTJC_06810 [Campylobacter sp.]